MILTIIFVVSALVRAEDCEQMRVSLTLEKRKITEFERLQILFREKYDRYVKSDFDEQAAGLFEGLYRNKAKKVLFAQKRLLQSIHQAEVNIIEYRNSYCELCAPTSQSIGPSYCQECVRDPRCLLLGK